MILQVDDQIKRFTGFPGIPEDEIEAQKRVTELRRALTHAASTPAMLEAIGDRLMLSIRYFPLPVDVEVAAEYVRNQMATSDKPVINCEKCGGVGFISRRKLKAGIPYDFAAPCQCRTLDLEESEQ